MVYAQSESELLRYYNNIMKQDPHAYTTKYPQLAKHIQQFWDRRTEWGLWFRLDKMTRGNNTNNYAEAGIRVLKEIIFGRVKAYILIQFITITMEAYFKNRLLDIAHSRFRPGVALRYKALDKTSINVIEIKKVREHIYYMKEDVPKIGMLEYFIDMDIGTCSCLRGSNGAACKHQAAVAKHFKIASVNIAPIHSKQARKIYAKIATGTTMCLDFYADLRDQSKTIVGTLSITKIMTSILLFYTYLLTSHQRLSLLSYTIYNHYHSACACGLRDFTKG